MGEKLPTRREADQFNFESSEKYQAISTLTNCGLLLKMDNLELYHGRSGNQSDDWSVKAGFDNSGNNTGNANINKRPALNTSYFDIASEFATRRAKDSYIGTPEVHRILSSDPDARIINPYFQFSTLNRAKQTQFMDAIRTTLPAITEGAPVDFAHRKSLQGISPRDFTPSDATGFIYEEDSAKNATNLHLDPTLSHNLIAAKNTRHLLGSYPQLYQNLFFAYIYNQPNISINNGKGNHDLPISHEYLSNWFRNTHIVGCKMNVSSATLNHRAIDNYLLFDLEKINTDPELLKRQRSLFRRFGQISLAAERQRSDSNLAKSLTHNLYLKPQEIISMAKSTPGYKEIFESDTGNWEKFTLEEHTETVLKLFDDNYADLLPASTLPIMRLALLVHDIGKPEAVMNQDKKEQETYNVKVAEDFMLKNNIKPASRKLILTMIGDGLDYATRWMIKREPNVGREFYAFCERTMQEYLGTPSVDSATVTGFRNMLEVLQTCDSAAYTTMAVTRSVKEGVIYRNYGSFDSSFEQYHGLSGNRARIKKS